MSLYEFAQGLILEAGNKVRIMMKEDLSIETKSNPNDLVTNVDKATENYIYDAILRVILIIASLVRKDMDIIWKTSMVWYGLLIQLMEL